MDARPIGVFDSGLGGLTAVRQLTAGMPDETIVYFGDTGRVPYGSRSRDTIRRYARQDAAFLLSPDVKMVIAACGTVSSVAADLGESLPVPFLGVLTPTARAAAAATKTGKIGVIGTTATIRSGSYRRALAAIDPTLQVFDRDCPLFVPLVENGRFRPGDTVIETVAREYLTPLRDTGIDTLILGCTHYPLLAEVIAGVMGSGVTLIDSGASAARALRQALSDKDLLAQRASGTLTLYASDQPQDFGALAPQFLRRPLEGAVLPVDIERY